MYERLNWIPSPFRLHSAIPDGIRISTLHLYVLESPVRHGLALVITNQWVKLREYAADLGTISGAQVCSGSV